MAGNWGIEQGSIISKRGPAFNEDALVLRNGFWAVVDGSTDKSGLTFELDGEEVTGGRFAAQIITLALRSASDVGDPRTTVDELSEQLRNAVEEQFPGLSADKLPSARIAALDAGRDVAWSVGDCQIGWEGRLGHGLHDGASPLDRSLADVRAAVLEAHLRLEIPPAGDSVDPGRDVILPFLRMQPVFANQTGEFAFGAINGTPVPDEHLWTLPLDGIDHVVLASDGYPFVTNSEGLLTLAEAEAELQEALGGDPLCIGRLRSTKGLQSGHASFDDRTWLSLLRS